MIQKNASKKNVLIVTTTFPRWQDDYYSSFVFYLSRCLVDDFRLIVLAPAHPGAKPQEEIANLLVHRFNYFWPKKFQLVCYNDGIISNLKRNKTLWLMLPFLFFFQFIGILRLIKKEKIDLIHAHWFFPSGLTAVLAAKFFKKPVIVTGHGSDLNLEGGLFLNKIKKIILRQAQAITVVGHFFAQRLTSLAPKQAQKISVVPMGIDTNLFFFEPIRNTDQPKLLFVGRLSSAKGVGFLIRALPKILEKFPQASLEIIGRGREEKQLIKLVNKLKLADKVFFIGGVANQNLPNYYGKAAIFILPSFTEGVPVVIMEAMASGTPVVATRVGGVPELIENEKTGLLIEPKNEDEIAVAVTRLLSDDNLRKKIVIRARQKIEKNYDWQIIKSKFKKIYYSLT